MFNWQRFFLLANAHWTEYRKVYAWFIGIGIMIHFVLLLIMFTDNSGFRSLSTDGQKIIYFSGLFLTAPIFAARYFQLMSKRESALIILMRPASVFEKWLLAFLIVALLYSVVYTLAFYICNIPGWLIAQTQAQIVTTNTYAPNYSSEKYELFFVFKHVKNSGDLVGIALSLTILQAFAVLGSLYFRAMPFIKTLLFAFFILLVSIFVTVFFNGRVDSIFDYWGSHRALSSVQQIMYPFMWISLPALLWLSCYFALKEREVA
jgi:hypothetical protein